MVAGEGHTQAVGRVFGAKSAPFPGKGPVAAIGTFRGVRFLFPEIVTCQVRVQDIAQEGFSGGLRRGAFEPRARSGLLEFVRVTGDAPGRVDPHVEAVDPGKVVVGEPQVPRSDALGRHLRRLVRRRR